jgi:tetratricopeptide (TPR) repeat protein
MFRRSIFPLVSLLCFCLPLKAQQQQQMETRADLYVNVAYEDERPAAQFYRVQLFTGGRMPMGEQFTNDRGQVIFHGLGAGSYMVSVRGTDIETAETTFAVNARESMHWEYIRVRRKPSDGNGTSSTQGSISAAALNVPPKALKEFDKGLAAFNKQDFPEARERFTKATEIYPQYAMAYLNLGVIATKENNMEEGQRCFQRAIQADPQNPSGYTYLARIDIMNSKYLEAESLLAKAVSITPLDPEVLTILATSQLRSGNLDEAVINAKKVHTVPHQQYAIAHLVAAEALMKQHLPDMAADEFRLFLKESPDGPNAVSARAALQSIESRMK